MTTTAAFSLAVCVRQSADVSHVHRLLRSARPIVQQLIMVDARIKQDMLIHHACSSVGVQLTALRISSMHDTHECVRRVLDFAQDQSFAPYIMLLPPHARLLRPDNWERPVDASAYTVQIKTVRGELHRKPWILKKSVAWLWSSHVHMMGILRPDSPIDEHPLIQRIPSLAIASVSV